MGVIPPKREWSQVYILADVVRMLSIQGDNGVALLLRKLQGVKKVAK